MNGYVSVGQVLAGERRWAMVHGDCTTVLAALAEPVDHVITDPPYEAEAHQKSRRSQRGPAALRKDGRGFVTMPLGFEAMDPATRWACGKHFARLARRWCLVFCQLEAVRPWRDACEHYGLTHRRTCLWVKPDSAPQFTGDRPGTGYETIEVLHAAGKSRWNGGGKRGVFTYSCHSQTRNPDEDHQTPKPLELMMELVELFTDPGDVILDPFAGAGATLVAALRLGRRAIGIELDGRYYGQCVERLTAEESLSTVAATRAGQVPLFGGP